MRQPTRSSASGDSVTGLVNLKVTTETHLNLLKAKGSLLRQGTWDHEPTWEEVISRLLWLARKDL